MGIVSRFAIVNIIPTIKCIFVAIAMLSTRKFDRYVSIFLSSVASVWPCPEYLIHAHKIAFCLCAYWLRKRFDLYLVWPNCFKARLSEQALEGRMCSKFT